MSAPPVCPFARPLYPPSDPRRSKPGPDVVAVKRGLSRAGFLPWAQFNGVYTEACVVAVKEFQKTEGIRATGNYGLASHEALRHTHREGYPDQWALDKAACDLFKQAYDQFHQSPAEKAAARIVEVAFYWVSKRGEIHYAEIRPFPLVKPPAVPGTTDCSGFAITTFYAADAPDPTGGIGYRTGQGYTGTLVGQGVQVPEEDADVGCLAFYGFTTHPSPAFPYGSPTHVAVCVPGGNVVEHGEEAGPLYLPLHYRNDLHSIRRYALVA